MKVFIWTLAMKPGGPESLHQLADSCTRQGFECYLYYDDRRRQVSPLFACYPNLQVVDQIKDSEDCVVVLPEICTHVVPMVKKGRVVFWWLSVDNNKGQFTDFQNPHIVHAYQSEYARLHLQASGCTRCYPLHDYINDFYRLESAPCRDKLNLITFNPFKGFEFTQPIIERLCRTYGFAPLARLDRQQVKELLMRTKVYIDFGNHPGKDRLPREAALMRNCIVVGAGAASNSEDIPIPARYRFDVQEGRSPDGLDKTYAFNLDGTCALIDAIMNDHEAHVRNFEPYVQHIRQAKEEFDRQVAALFGRLAAGRED